MKFKTPRAERRGRWAGSRGEGPPTARTGETPQPRCKPLRQRLARFEARSQAGNHPLALGPIDSHAPRITRAANTRPPLVAANSAPRSCARFCSNRTRQTGLTEAEDELGVVGPLKHRHAAWYPAHVEDDVRHFAGFASRIHFPPPVHTDQAFSMLGFAKTGRAAGSVRGITDSLTQGSPTIFPSR